MIYTLEVDGSVLSKEKMASIYFAKDCRRMYFQFIVFHRRIHSHQNREFRICKLSFYGSIEGLEVVQPRMLFL